jgi:predicted GH43/DUF377 family glycosyl hydrolase
MGVTWQKLGRVYVARGERAWAQTHAYCPTPVALGDGRVRVLCAFLDDQKVGRLGWVDVDEHDPTRVLAVAERPALDVGAPGAFDDSGVTPLSAVRLADGTLRLYYAGWQLGTRVRYFLFTGVAESTDGGESFRRVSEAPVLDRSDGELHVRTGGHVRRDGERWRMWYAGGSDWVGSDAGAKPRYALRHLASDDGLRWGAHGEVCLEPEGDDELGFGRPCVLADGDRMRMWYSVRTLSKGYRLGYAESADGLAWERRDGEAGLDVSATGWDSEMACLSCLLPTAHATYLFYNGNNYGETGFGVAVAEEL